MLQYYNYIDIVVTTIQTFVISESLQIEIAKLFLPKPPSHRRLYDVIKKHSL